MSAEKPEEKECPYCSENIKHTAKKCKHCGEILDVVLRAAEDAKKGPSVYMNAGGGGGGAAAASSSTAPAAVIVEEKRGCFSSIGRIVVWTFVGLFLLGLLSAIINPVPNNEGRSKPSIEKLDRNIDTPNTAPQPETNDAG
jgi:hypothetical protein